MLPIPRVGWQMRSTAIHDPGTPGKPLLGVARQDWSSQRISAEISTRSQTCTGVRVCACCMRSAQGAEQVGGNARIRSECPETGRGMIASDALAARTLVSLVFPRAWCGELPRSPDHCPVNLSLCVSQGMRDLHHDRNTRAGRHGIRGWRSVPRSVLTTPGSGFGALPHRDADSGSFRVEHRVYAPISTPTPAISAQAKSVRVWLPCRMPNDVAPLRISELRSDFAENPRPERPT